MGIVSFSLTDKTRTYTATSDQVINLEVVYMGGGDVINIIICNVYFPIRSSGITSFPGLTMKAGETIKIGTNASGKISGFTV